LSVLLFSVSYTLELVEASQGKTIIDNCLSLKEVTVLILIERIRSLNALDIKNRKYVLYWMQSSQRAEHNLALTYAILEANKLNKPLVAFFGIASDFPEANLRHYYFMLEGLREVSNSLKDIEVKTIVLNESPEKGAVKLAKDSCVVVVDKGYVKTLKLWYKFVAEHIDCPLIQVEDNVVVPLEEASGKEEYSAATLRPKILKKRQTFLNPLRKRRPELVSPNLELNSIDLKNIDEAISALGIDASVTKSSYFKGGTSQAIEYLEDFLENKLAKYSESKNDPTVDYESNMSPYLHFGQISPIYIALKVLDAPVSDAAKEAFLEELVVRRELAINFVNYNENYDSFAGLPNWAKNSLWSHKDDHREYLYTLEELENAKTHDPYWNAAQNEMRITGKMHGYMRMYWGKKIIEWSENPKTAFSTALFLNNKYELDGRDPNGYAGIAWCFGKHDRPWKNRAIFGNVRYMNANGLRRKFDIDKYVEKIKQL
jgi:deoxyribodipyrimidine photo-lyase